MRVWLLALACLAVAACDSEFSPGEVPSRAERGMPEWVAPSFRLSERTARAPGFDDGTGVVAFTIGPRDCSRARPDRAPPDCATGTKRSTIVTGTQWEFGERFLLSFEFNLDGALGAGAPAFDIARWRAGDDSAAVPFALTADPRRGVTFLGRTCIPAEEMGGWHRFDMRVKWAGDATGYLEVRCHGSLYSGAPIYARSDFAVNRHPYCDRDGACGDGRGRVLNDLRMEMGVIRRGPLARDLTVRIRRIVERQLTVVLNRVENL